MTTRRTLVTSVAVGLGLCVAASTWRVSGAVTRLDRAPSETTVLVELFTSEGCSSCPPADALLSEIIDRSPIAGVHVIGLSEHVDYWNQLGWRDPFSDALFTARQQKYAAHATGAAVDNVYTPQIVVDGETALVGSDASAARAAIAAAARRRKAPVRLQWTSGAPLTLDVVIEGSPADAGSRLLVAVAEDDVRVSVPRGENAGHTLAHSGVTRQLREIGRLDKSGAAHVATALSLQPSWRRDHLRAVVMVAAETTGRIAGVAELPLTAGTAAR